MTTDFSDDALLLIAHGSTVNTQSVRQLDVDGGIELKEALR